SRDHRDVLVPLRGPWPQLEGGSRSDQLPRQLSELDAAPREEIVVHREGHDREEEAEGQKGSEGPPRSDTRRHDREHLVVRGQPPCGHEGADEGGEGEGYGYHGRQGVYE